MKFNSFQVIETFFEYTKLHRENFKAVAHIMIHRFLSKATYQKLIIKLLHGSL